jgi:hypothetical protein
MILIVLKDLYKKLAALPHLACKLIEHIEILVFSR